MPEDRLQQGRLARAVGADDADRALLETCDQRSQPLRMFTPGRYPATHVLSSFDDDVVAVTATTLRGPQRRSWRCPFWSESRVLVASSSASASDFDLLAELGVLRHSSITGMRPVTAPRSVILVARRGRRRPPRGSSMTSLRIALGDDLRPSAMTTTQSAMWRTMCMSCSTNSTVIPRPLSIAWMWSSRRLREGRVDTGHRLVEHHQGRVAHQSAGHLEELASARPRGDAAKSFSLRASSLKRCEQLLAPCRSISWSLLAATGTA